MNNEAIEEAGKAIRAILEKLEWHERPEVIRRAYELGDWCFNCGMTNPLYGFCQCQNDE